MICQACHKDAPALFFTDRGHLCRECKVAPSPVELPCPNCYGGHFRPCQWCGDTGRVLFIPDTPRLNPERIRADLVAAGIDPDACWAKFRAEVLKRR